MCYSFQFINQKLMHEYADLQFLWFWINKVKVFVIFLSS